MRLTRARRSMRFFGLFSRLATSVRVSQFCLSCCYLRLARTDYLFICPSLEPELELDIDIGIGINHYSPLVLPGSRYIYDLYYEKEAISKQLYDWLLKNNYADANLIAKWKKQGYEKVSRNHSPSKMLLHFIFFPPSCLII